MVKKIRAFEISDIPAVKRFTDFEIGQDYYSLSELQEIYRKSFSGGTMCTFVLEVDGEIEGVRITFPPGKWSQGKGRGLSPDLWPHPLSETAYFQSLFIKKALTGKGLGKELSNKAIEILRSIGARGIVCHSWKESPQHSSARYLRSLGFQRIATYPLYWQQVDYQCPRCGKPCQCTAEEMYLDLDWKEGEKK